MRKADRALVLALAILATGCATVPPELEQVHTAVNQRARYRFYEARDFRYLKAGDTGNCAAFAESYRQDLAARGIRAEVKVCVLKSGQGHAYTVAKGFALDNRFRWVTTEDQVGCQEVQSTRRRPH